MAFGGGRAARRPVLCRGSRLLKEVEISGRDASAKRAAAETQAAVLTAVKSGNTLVTETAGHKEIFSVLGEADGASDTAVVSSGGLHQRRIGIRFGRDRGNSLHERIYVFSVIAFLTFSLK